MKIVYVAASGPHCHLERPEHNESNFRRGTVCDVAEPRRRTERR